MAVRMKGRFGYHYEEPFRVTFHPDRLDELRKWKKPCRVFVCSMGDLFHEDVVLEMLDMIWRCMARNKQHTFMVLTKRPERLLEWYQFIRATAPNIWLGVTAENQDAANARIPILLQIPAAVRFVSCEPLLGPVDFSKIPFSGFLKKDSTNKLIGWVICGGESGPKARPMHPDWARSLRDQCQAADVKFFFKGWGKFGHTSQDENGHWRFDKLGKKVTGRLLDGREWNEWPG